VCPATPAYFGDQNIMRCVLTCPENTFSYYNNTYRLCVTYCPPQVYLGVNPITVNLFADNSTWTCVAVCPSTPNYFAFTHPTITTIRTCVSTCPLIASTYYFADNMTRSCVTVCPFNNQTTYGDPLTFLCTKTCSRTQFRLNTTFRCVWTCPTSLIIPLGTVCRSVPTIHLLWLLELIEHASLIVQQGHTQKTKHGHAYQYANRTITTGAIILHGNVLQLAQQHRICTLTQPPKYAYLPAHPHRQGSYMLMPPPEVVCCLLLVLRA
jgi:hypothetical protein